MVIHAFVNYASSYVFTSKTSNSTAPHKSQKRRSHRPQHSINVNERAGLPEGFIPPKGEQARYDLVDEILAEDDLYKVLGIGRTCQEDEIRRAYIGRSRVCHPDKFPGYPASTAAFQKVSFAYETLSKPSSRCIYDISGRLDFGDLSNGKTSSGGFGDETLHGVLHAMFCEFVDGDFEMIRVFVNALNQGNPGLNLGDDAVENLEGVFRRLREIFLAGQKYFRVIRFELIRLYEIQHSLRQLSYFDVFGRLRLTLQLARVTLSIPMAVDKAMREDSVQDPEGLGKEVAQRGLLGKRTAGVLNLACRMLEKGEQIV